MAMRAYHQRRREIEDAELERQLRAILAASGAATHRFGVQPDRFFWCGSLRCPVVSYDDGDIELARDRGGEWHVVHVCGACGQPIRGGLVVHDLAEVGAALLDGPTLEDYDGHYCIPAEAMSRRLSDYLGESAA
jgi:hypothetical protein